MKLFKVLLAASAALLLGAGCQKYDDTALSGRVSDLEKKVSTIDGQINDLRQAINDKVTVKDVQETATGWIINLTNNTSITLSNGKDGKDGKDGDTFFTSVTIEGGYVKIVLNDEGQTTFLLPMAKRIVIGADNEDFIAIYGNGTDVQYTLPDVEISTVAATVLHSDGSATDIMTKAAKSDWTVEVIDNSKIHIAVSAHPLSNEAILQVTAIADDGTTYIASKLVRRIILTYHGVEYKLVKLANGTVWMAENLRYVPESCKLGEPGEEGANIFYPYSTDGTNTTALTDDGSIAKLGLLYSGDVLFNTPITQDNLHDFAGAQGICPQGWHIPTRAEYLALCGSSNKDDSGTETGTVTDETALFYDATYKAGKVKKFNDAGWNFTFSGCVFNGAYNKTAITADKCKYDEWVGSCAMNYYWASTGYKGSKPQFFALMSTFTAANNEGKVSLGYCNSSNAAPLRCVKN